MAEAIIQQQQWQQRQQQPPPPPPMPDREAAKFMELKQGNKSIAECEAQFTELARFTPHIVLDRALIAERNVASRKQNFEWKGRKQNFSKGTTSSNKKFKSGNSGNTGSSQSGDSTSACTTCGKKHRGVCYRATGARYHCGKFGRIAKDCTQPRQGGNQGATSSIGSTSTTKPAATSPTTRNEQRPMETLNYMLCVASPVGRSMLCSTMFIACELFLGDATLYADLIPLDMGHFDVVLDMDWLTKYYATIDCASKRVIFRPPGQDEFYFEGNGVVSPPYLISAMKARKLMNKGRQGYLCSVITEATVDITLDSIPVVRDFPDVFPNELLGQLVDREIEFIIDVIPGTRPISKTSYRMSTTEMKELKIQ
ncbi:uncharacterized protein LOC114258557 [Camellia sinensis]|uniref:uncharacterized protein LOC114258557 n=1 Tax=Camellia sinensis TaxID=4442 RepID=UPI001035DAA5|nr:uncharacterized protein LOC114258557 [Camellia sinensis]